MRRLGATLGLTAALMLSAAACVRTVEEEPPPEEPDAVAGLAAIAEAVDANHVQALTAHATADGFEVIALMMADGPSGPWLWDAATGEVTEAVADFPAVVGPVRPTDTATMSQALAAVESCAEEPMSLTASALGAELIQVQQTCGSGDEQERHQYIDGSAVDGAQVDLTDADDLSTAFDYATRALGDQQIATVRVEYTQTQALRVIGTRVVDSTEGEPNACLPAYAFVVDAAGSQPVWQLSCRDGDPGAPAVPVPFDPAVAASVYEEASAEGEPSLLTYTFQDDALVYTVLVDDQVLRFDPHGDPLDGQ